MFGLFNNNNNDSNYNTIKTLVLEATFLTNNISPPLVVLYNNSMQQFELNHVYVRNMNFYRNTIHGQCSKYGHITKYFVYNTRMLFFK